MAQIKKRDILGGEESRFILLLFMSAGYVTLTCGRP